MYIHTKKFKHTNYRDKQKYICVYMYLQTFKIKILHYFLQISFYTTTWDFFSSFIILL